MRQTISLESFTPRKCENPVTEEFLMQVVVCALNYLILILIETSEFFPLCVFYSGFHFKMKTSKMSTTKKILFLYLAKLMSSWEF